ncbi:MAG: rhomboid family intramembrane serine protease [Thermoguttaceae bacterium]
MDAATALMDQAPADRLAEFTRTMTELTPRVWVTWAIIAVNVLAFLLMTASGVSPVAPTVQDLLRWGADFGPKTANGEWWRLLTCTFVHIGFLHILLNMWCLAAAGPFVERMLGNIGFLVLYLVAGLCGSVVSLLWNPLLVSAGASGAIFGVYGALLGILRRQRSTIPAKVLAQLRNGAGTFLLYNVFYGVMQAARGGNVDFAAHIGGLAGGVLGGIVLGQPITREALAGRFLRNIMLAGVGAILLLGVLLSFRVSDAESELGPKVGHGDVEVYYDQGATREEANRLGAYFVKHGWGNGGASVQLKNTDAGYQVRMVVKKEYQNTQTFLSDLAFMGARLSRDVFDGGPVEVHVCGDNFETLRVVPPRPDIRYSVVDGVAEVFFAAVEENAEAKRVAEYLAGAFRDWKTQGTFKLVRRGTVVELHVLVGRTLLKDESNIGAWLAFRERIASELFKGVTVEIHLCDEGLNVVRVLTPSCSDTLIGDPTTDAGKLLKKAKNGQAAPANVRPPEVVRDEMGPKSMANKDFAKARGVEYTPPLTQTRRPGVAANRVSFESVVGGYITADDGQFLGRISTSDLEPDSILNDIGRYGSDVSGTSIFNDIGKYGSDVSRLSPFNDIASVPPRIYTKDGEFVACLTVNELKTPGLDPRALVGWLRSQ